MKNQIMQPEFARRLVPSRRSGVLTSLLAVFTLSLILAARAHAEGLWCPRDFRVFKTWLVTKDDATPQERFVADYLMKNPVPLMWSHSMQEIIRTMYTDWQGGGSESAD